MKLHVIGNKLPVWANG